MKNILVIHQNLGNGGAEKQIAYFANLLSKKYNVYLALLENKTIVHDISKKIKILQLQREETRGLKQMGIKEAWKFIVAVCKDIKKLVEQNKIDLIIAYKDREVFLAWIVACITKTKILVSQRGDHNDKNWYWRYILKIIYNHSNGVIFQLPQVQKFYCISDKKSRVIPNPSTLNFRDVREKRITSKKILAAGRFQYRKRFDLLIQAFYLVHQKYPEYKLFIYGDGEERERLQTLVCNLGLREFIFMPGFMRDVIQNNIDSEMFVFTSDSEGIPNILIEALSAGIPCVATDCLPGGASFLLNEGNNGILVERDSENALAEAMECFICNKDFANKCAENGKKYMKNFDVSIIDRKFLAYVKDMVGE